MSLMGCHGAIRNMESAVIHTPGESRTSSTPALEDSQSDGTRSSVPPSRPRKRIPGEEWEAKRPIITKLYQEEKKSLKEVMDILERDHRFRATCVPPPCIT